MSRLKGWLGPHEVPQHTGCTWIVAALGCVHQLTCRWASPTGMTACVCVCVFVNHLHQQACAVLQGFAAAVACRCAVCART